jgi:hypothetical protein
MTYEGSGIKTIMDFVNKKTPVYGTDIQIVVRQILSNGTWTNKNGEL